MIRWIRRVASAAIIGIGLISLGQAQIEFIPATLVPAGGPPGVTLDYPNVLVPPPHEKVFHFGGGAESLGFPAPTPFVVYFDWTTSGGTFTSPPMTFLLAPFTTTGIDTGDFILPFCPSNVSIHFESPGATPALVTGSFSHICRPVPEPTGISMLMVVLAAPVGLGLFRRRSRRSFEVLNGQ